jgi:site-specific DNA-methyltransferase (adenine-specific)
MLTAMRNLETTYVDIAELTPYHRNPNHGDIGVISESLETLDQYRTIVVNVGTLTGRPMEVLAGNHTMLAARALGHDKIAVNLVDEDDETCLRIVTVDNRSAALATTDDDVLAELLIELAATNDGLLATGYDGDDLDQLLAELNSDKGGREGDTPEPPADPVTQLGDVWQLGPHRLYCGDAFDLTLDGDTVVTDPPYGMNLDADFTYHQANDYGKGGNRYRPVIGDDHEFDPTPLLDRYDHVSEQVWFGGDYYRQHLPVGGSWLVWDKRTDLEYGYDDSALDDLFGSQFELAWCRQRHKRQILRYVWSGHHGLQREDTDSRIHPTQKPVALMEHVIQLTSGLVIIDPFAGSGSTLIAAENLGVTCNAIELDPAYCDTIVDRYRSLSPNADIRRTS